MGLKTESIPTNSRSKQNPRDYKIKQIIETTRCTHSEAEEALQECNNELEAAVTWVLDHTGDNIWTESKTRKIKKTDVVEERPSRGETGSRRGRPRGGPANARPVTVRSEIQPAAEPVSDNVWTESKPRKPRNSEVVEEQRPARGEAFNRRGKSSNPWKGGQVFTRTEPQQQEMITPPLEMGVPAPAPVKPVQVIKTAAGPLSFAAACAAGGKKPQPPAPAPPVATPAKAPSASTTPVKPMQSAAVASPSTAKEPSPSLADTPVKSTPSMSKPETSTPDAPKERFNEDNSVQSLTSQLKNDLGLGSSPGKNVAAPTSKLISASSTSAATNVPNTRGTVEFASELNPGKAFEYHFGFNPESSPADESSFKSSNNAVQAQNEFRSHENDVYKSSNVESTPPASKNIVSAATQLSNSYGVPPQSQQPQHAQSAQQQVPRRNAFGYAETSTVSFPPENRPAVNSTPAAPATTTPASSNYAKPAVTAQSSFSHPQQAQVPQQMHQQHTSQQQMYNPMYSSYPYVNLYSPVAGRAEDTPYAAPYHMPYAYNMDALAQMMPHMPMQAPVPGHHPQQQTTHRADHHQSFNDMKQTYGQGAAAANPNTANQSGQRDANMSSSVPPPPGFSGPPTNHMFTNQIQSMFYPPMFMHKMPNQMYGQQGVEDAMDVRHQAQPKLYGQQDKYSNGSNVRDRMVGGGGAQPTPPPTQGGYAPQNSYSGNGQMNSVLNSKKQQYHGGQWNQ